MYRHPHVSVNRQFYQEDQGRRQAGGRGGCRTANILGRVGAAPFRCTIGFSVSLTSYGISDIGSVRQNNEDRILVDQPMSAFAVFDGIGGHRSGEVAAETALATFHHYLESSQNPMEVTWPYGYNAKLLVESNRLLT